MFLVVRGSNATSARGLIATVLRKENRSHDWFEKRYSRLPESIKDRLPFRLHPWEVERGWAVEELKSQTNQSAVIVPRLLDAIRSGQLSPDEIDLFASVIVHHPQMAEMSLPVLLSLAATNRNDGWLQVRPVARLAPKHPDVFVFVSNQLVRVLLEPGNVATSHVQQARLHNWRRNVLLSFAHLEGHTIERSNLLERLLRDAHGPGRAELASAYRHYRFPHPEQAWVLERLSRDADDWIQNTALEGLTYHSDADEVSLQVAVKRLNEILYDEAEPPRLRSSAAEVSRWLGSMRNRVAPAVAYWLRTEDDFDGHGFAQVVDDFTSEGIALPGVTERLSRAMQDPPSAQLAEHCLAHWYCTLDTAGALSLLVTVVATSQGDEQKAAVQAMELVLRSAKTSPSSHLTAAGKATALERQRAVLAFIGDQPRLVPFLDSLKTALERQPPDFRRVMGGSLHEFVRQHEAAAK
jgi:hypothetical protein